MQTREQQEQLDKHFLGYFQSIDGKTMSANADSVDLFKIGRIFNSYNAPKPSDQYVIHGYEQAIKSDEDLKRWVAQLENEISNLLFGYDEFLKNIFLHYQQEKLFKTLLERFPIAFELGIIRAYFIACVTYPLVDWVEKKHPFERVVEHGVIIPEDENAVHNARINEDAYRTKIDRYLQAILDGREAAHAARKKECPSPVKDIDRSLDLLDSILDHKKEEYEDKYCQTDGPSTTIGSSLPSPRSKLDSTNTQIGSSLSSPSSSLEPADVSPPLGVTTPRVSTTPLTTPATLNSSAAKEIQPKGMLENKEADAASSKADRYVELVESAIGAYRSLNPPKTSCWACFFHRDVGRDRADKLERLVIAAKSNKNIAKLNEFVDKITSGQDYSIFHRRRDEGLDSQLIKLLTDHQLPVLTSETYSRKVTERLDRRSFSLMR